MKKILSILGAIVLILGIPLGVYVVQQQQQYQQSAHTPQPSVSATCSNGTVTLSYNYILTNLPSGVTAKITVTDSQNFLNDSFSISKNNGSHSKSVDTKKNNIASGVVTFLTTASDGFKKTDQKAYSATGPCVTPTPTIAPTPTPTTAPTPTPTIIPTATPTPSPTPVPTGTPAPTPTAQPSPSSTPPPQPTTPPTTGTPGCSNTAPSSAPNLYQINPGKNSATLYFTPAGNPVTNHVITYGTTSSADSYAVTTNIGQSSGAIQYTINSLQTCTVYYYKVYGTNGCAPGSSSQIVSSKTQCGSVASLPPTGPTHIMTFGLAGVVAAAAGVLIFLGL